MPSESKTGIRLQFAKLNQERRLVTAIASTVTDANGNPVVDLQGDVIPIEELEEAFIEAFSFGGHSRGGEMHKVIGGADIVQHFTLSSDERIALGFGPGPEVGIVKFRINDDELWDKVKSGKLPEVSIGGSAVRTPIDG